MRKNMHHRIEHGGRHGAGSADVAAELHDAIGGTAKAEGGGITEGETGDGEFIGM